MIPYTNCEHFRIIRFRVMLRTNRQTNKQTDSKILYPRRPIQSLHVRTLQPIRTAHMNAHIQSYNWVHVQLSTVVHNTAQNSSDNLPSYPPDGSHSSDIVHWRGRVRRFTEFAEKNDISVQCILDIFILQRYNSVAMAIRAVLRLLSVRRYCCRLWYYEQTELTIIAFQYRNCRQLTIAIANHKHNHNSTSLHSFAGSNSAVKRLCSSC